MIPLIEINGERHVFIPHSGRSRLNPIDLPPRNKHTHRPTTQIQELVALSYGLHPKHMTAQYRGTKKASWARMVAMYLTRELTDRSLPSIGKGFGGRHHTTVIHACREVTRLMVLDPLKFAEVAALRRVLTR